MQFLTFGAHVIHELVQHVPSHPLPCASPCTAEGPHSARLLFRYCSLSPAPLHPLHSQQNMLMRARPSSTDAVASARGHLPAPRLQGSAKARKTPLRTPVRCPSRLLSPSAQGAVVRMSLEYPGFGQRTSSSTDSPTSRKVLLTCCWAADSVYAPSPEHSAPCPHIRLAASVCSSYGPSSPLHAKHMGLGVVNSDPLKNFFHVLITS